MSPPKDNLTHSQRPLIGHKRKSKRRPLLAPASLRGMSPYVDGSRTLTNAFAWTSFNLRRILIVTSNLKRVLRFTIMLGIAVLGVLIWKQSENNLFVEGCVFGLMGLGVVGFGLSELGLPGAATRGAVAEDGDAATIVRPEERRFADNVETVVHLLQTHLQANSGYADSLKRANSTLPSLQRPEQVREVVLFLIEANLNIQVKVSELSTKLDDSVAQIGQLRSHLADAKDEALHDALTGLGNRRFFDLKLNQALAAARAEANELCLAVCDFDRFKTINDKFGHPVGDTVLKLFGEVLSSNVKGKDTVARIGGEEFAIVFPNTKMADAVTVTDQIRAQLEAKKWMLGSSGTALGTITASFGVASLRAGEGTNELFQRADRALYQAKSDGRNRVVSEKEL
jgi:diguanylate cyclase